MRKTPDSSLTKGDEFPSGVRIGHPVGDENGGLSELSAPWRSKPPHLDSVGNESRQDIGPVIGIHPGVFQARAQLLETLCHQFKDLQLFHRALTHRSAVEREADSLEQLEIIGDAALHLVASRFAVEYSPGMQRSSLEHTVKRLVENEFLSSMAWSIGIPDALAYRSKQPLPTDSKAYADAMEALIGALYRDGGISAVISFLRPLLGFEGRRPEVEGPTSLGRVAAERKERLYGSLLEQLYGRSLHGFSFDRSLLVPHTSGSRPYRMSELEYLGHSVFRFAIRENYLYRHPDAQPADIVRHRTSLVERSAVSLKLKTRVADPGDRAVIEKHRDGPVRLMKGLLGAVYLDRGLEHAFDATDYFFRGSSGIKRVPVEDPLAASSPDPREQLRYSLKGTRAKACEITVKPLPNGAYRASVRIGRHRAFARADDPDPEIAQRIAAARAIEKIESHNGVRGPKGGSGY